MGPVELTVTDLGRSIDFYERAIGLQEQSRDDGRAALGAGGEELVVLVEQPGARPPGRHAGLYHFALLHPSRRELARALRRLQRSSTEISGASDHQVSEAIYLSDPDGNGIELASDRPNQRWPDVSDPGALMPEPLDLQGLLGTIGPDDAPGQADPGLVIGHVHLHVGDLEQGLAHYWDVLGFEPMAVVPSVAFVSAGGYHHHLAFNTWRGEGVPPAPPEAVGLRLWTVVLEDEGQVGEVRDRVVASGSDYEARDGGVLVRDPWKNAVLFTAK